MLDSKPSSTMIAKQMIRRHGLQANAMAHEREALARLAPDAEALSLWGSVHRSIAELRGTAIRAAPDRMPSAGGAAV